jgi:hypothetical protein
MLSGNGGRQARQPNGPYQHTHRSVCCQNFQTEAGPVTNGFVQPRSCKLIDEEEHRYQFSIELEKIATEVAALEYEYGEGIFAEHDKVNKSRHIRRSSSRSVC